ncbi:hypothetical protein MRX96_016559 [Rhipicephalus microplus]
MGAEHARSPRATHPGAAITGAGIIWLQRDAALIDYDLANDWTRARQVQAAAPVRDQIRAARSSRGTTARAGVVVPLPRVTPSSLSRTSANAFLARPAN